MGQLSFLKLLYETLILNKMCSSLYANHKITLKPIENNIKNVIKKSIFQKYIEILEQLQ